MPSTLPVWLITLGIESMFLGVVINAVKQQGLYSQYTRRERLVGVLGLGLGYFFIALSLIQGNFGLYGTYLFILFRAVEGAAAVLIFVRLLTFFRGGYYSSSVFTKVRHILVVFFITTLGVSLLLKILIDGPFIGSLWYNLSLVYTVLVVVLTLISVRWRLRKVQADTNLGVTGGIALGVAGGQIYSFSLASEIAILLLGSLVYTIGFWSAASLLFSSGIWGLFSSSTCSQCDADLSQYNDPEFCPQCGNST
ncbi:hypothetical protein [Haloferax gibbonsii]|uniref:hypothetical protein n=1 Tax=Haloferax gibbonsii TaxID=35746 RepID=UPI001267EC9A|nr:hypothetical protein [Haloferax gibbonsii]